VLEDGRWSGGVRGLCQRDRDGDEAGPGCGGVAERAVPGNRPAELPDLTADGMSRPPEPAIPKRRRDSPSGSGKDHALIEPLINYSAGFSQ
jgi:hypothetical protein